MPQSYDGDIRLSVELTAEEAVAAARDLQDDISNIFESISGKKLNSQFKSLQASMSATVAKAQALRDRMWDLANQKIPTEEYQTIQNQISESTKKLSVLTERMEKFKELGGKTDSKAFKSMEYDADQLRNTIEYAKGELQDLENTGKAFTFGIDSTEYEELGQQLGEVNNKLLVLRTRAEEALDKPSLWQRFITGARNATKRCAELAKQLLKLSASAIKTGIHKLSNAFANLGKKSNAVTKGFQHGFKNLLRYGIGVRSLFALINKLRRAFTEGMNNLAQSYEPFGETLQNFKTALASLKNNFAAAFEPVLSTILPILTTLINALNTVISKIGQFFAALKGQTTYLKGAAKAQKSYGSAMGGSAKKAEELQRQLAGFDDVQILKSPNDSSGGGGGGSNGSEFENLFETAEVDSDIINFVNKLKTLFKQQDWAGLGTLIADGINTAFQKAKDLITSDELREKVRTIITGITETANTLVSGVDWELIGSTFGEGFNLIVDILDSLITGFDWISIGTSLANGLNSLITTIDWAALGKLFADRLNILIDTLHGFLFGDGESGGFDWVGAAQRFSESLMSFIRNIHWAEAGQNVSQALIGALQYLNTALQEFNWQELGNDIYEFLANIDWAELITQVFELIGSVIGGLVGLVAGILEPIWQNIVDWFNGKTEEWKEQGVDIVGGILLGILEAVGNIFIWIYDNIFKPIYDGICKAFGISSPAKEMKEPGRMIIEGLKKGITDAMKKIGDWINEKIFGPIQEAFETTILMVKVGLEKAAQWSKDAWDALKKGGQTVISTVKAAVQKATTWVADAWTAATMKTQEVIRTVKSALEKVGSWASDVWEAVTMKTQEVTRKVKSALEKAGGWASDVWEAITMKASSITRTVISAVKKADTWISDAWAAAKLSATTIYRGLVESVSKAGGAWSDAAWEAAKMVAGTVRRTLEITARLVGSAWDAIKRLVTGRAEGGVYVNGRWQNLPQFAQGGVIPKYAGGTANAHGTMFVAGEHGPEIVGNINGRTEILNKSQIASAIYSAVLNAMGTTVNALGKFISSMLANTASVLTANTIILQTALNNIQVPTVTDKLAEISNIVGKLSDITTHSMVPAVANGAIIPYSVGTQMNEVSTDIKELLNAVLGMPLFTRDELSDIIDDVLRRRLNIEFYIGDEQIAKHANAGNIKLDRRYNR